MTKILVKENETEDVNILLSSTSPNIEQVARKDGKKVKIKHQRSSLDDIIKSKSTNDPFKFITQVKQEKQGNDATTFKVKKIAGNNVDPEFKMYRQGDILFRKIFKLPTNLIIKSDNIVAGGEAEGATHAHLLVDGDLFQLETSDPKLYIRTNENTRLIHEEDLPIRLEQGIYEVIRQREYLGAGLMKKEAIVRYVSD